MGLNISSLFNSTPLFDLNNNHPNNNIENNITENNQINEQSLLYSYFPNISNDEEGEDNNKLKCIKTIKGHRKWCNCLILLKSNNLCSCSGDKSINIYSNDNNFNIILTLSSCHEDFILYMAEIYDNVIASSSSDGTIKFWKIFINSNDQNININNNTYYLMQTIIGHENDIWKILFINERNELVSCGSDSLIKIWGLNYIINNNNNNNEKDLLNYELVKTSHEHKFWISSIIQVRNFKKNINYLVSGSGDNTVKFYDINNDYILIHTINKALCCQQDTLVNYNDKQFLIGGGRGIFFYVINFIHFQIEAKIFGGNEEVNTILVLKNNKYIKNGGFLVGGKKCCFYYITENTFDHMKIKNKAHEKYIYCLLQIGDNLIASSSYDNDIKIWEYDEHTFE